MGPGNSVAATSVTGLRLLAGCRLVDDAVEDCLGDTSKDAGERRWHLLFETWSGVEYWESWVENANERSPLLLGEMGYQGSQGSYLKGSTASAAISRNGISPLFYANYNATWFAQDDAFYNISNFDTSCLLACSEMPASNSYYLERYASFFKEEEGLGYEVNGDGIYSFICHAGYWWLSPACRNTPSECIPYLTNEHGHGFLGLIMKSTYYDMPFALGFARSNPDRFSLLARRDLVLYGWEPDALTAASDLHEIVFPPYNKTLHETGLLITREQRTKLYKWALRGLDEYSFSAYEVAKNMSFDLTHINSMLGDLVAGLSHYDAACNWLKRTSAWRAEWLQLCPAGSQYTHSHATAAEHAAFADLTCRPCPAGTFRGDEVRQKGCHDCPAGRFSSTEGSTACEECPQGSHAASTGSQVCDRCALWHTTSQAGAVKSQACIPDRVPVAMLFAFIALCLASVAALLVHAHHKKKQFHKIMHKLVTRGFEAMEELQHPMCIISGEDFQAMSLSDVKQCHEGARIAGKVVFLDTLEAVEAFQGSGMKVLFFSYAWKSWSRIGPDELQLSCMQDSLRRLCERNSEEMEDMYVWLDVLSIPQLNTRTKSGAVDSLFNYASIADYMVAICPDGIHEDSKEPAGPDAYKSRVWCRVEQVAHYSVKGVSSMFRSLTPGSLEAIEEAWIMDVLPIFDARTTCCRLGHPGHSKCDRELLVPTLLAMFVKILAEVNEQERSSVGFRTFWQQIEDDLDHIFPQTFIYNCSDGRHTKPLFGPLLKLIRQAGYGLDGMEEVHKILRSAPCSVVFWNTKWKPVARGCCPREAS
eukprot:TRINITY_DN35692_c0_g1_i1.p1 TRINITY_DN35692_c0_g1~~TRINITY_DN35692_c0_g1_i1.p1  ORF type:complete len:899 (-),score=113.21 TRINITY_DN35692_c0_g1_i1:88-2535(-)